MKCYHPYEIITFRSIVNNLGNNGTYKENYFFHNVPIRL
jgi:hypothetical protein